MVILAQKPTTYKNSENNNKNNDSHCFYPTLVGFNAPIGLLTSDLPTDVKVVINGLELNTIDELARYNKNEVMQLLDSRRQLRSRVKNTAKMWSALKRLELQYHHQKILRENNSDIQSTSASDFDIRFASTSPSDSEIFSNSNKHV